MKAFSHIVIAAAVVVLTSTSPVLADDVLECASSQGDRIAACDRVIARGINLPAAYASRCAAYLSKNVDKARSDCNEAIKLDPKFARPYFGRALANRDLDGAISDYNEAIRLDPNYALAYRYRGLAYRTKGDVDRALSDYSEVIRIDPNASAYNDRGSIYFDKGDLDRALSDYDEAIRSDQKYALAYANRGLAFKSKGDLDRARTDLNEALRLDPSIDFARTALAGLTQSSPTAPAPAPVAPPASQGRRVALVIGNASYRKMPALRNPTNDAADVGDALKRLGFDVQVEIDADRLRLSEAIGKFSGKVPGAEVAIFYYSGHGMQFQGRNYLLPLDAELDLPADINRFRLLSLDDVVDVMGYTNGLQLIVLDACRNNPVERDFKAKVASLSPELSRDGGASRGFTRMDPRAGLLMAYSTSSNSTAADGTGRNSPFTNAFLNNLKRPNIEVRSMLFSVQSDVFKSTNRMQLPEISSLYIGPDVVLKSDR